MMRGKLFRGRGICWVFLGLVATMACISGCSTVQTSSAPGSSRTAEKVEMPPPSPPPARTTALPVQSGPPASTAYTATDVSTFHPTPDAMDLCGESVPLNLEDVYERFDREFTLVVYNHAQVYLWLKRMDRYFPSVEGRLRQLGLPDDLKYVAIVESDLMPNACSPKGAAGPWQFMPSTGSAYGLDQQGSCDQRFDFDRSTDSAFRLLGDLHRRYKNWALAIAAYNCGDKRILDEMRSQRVTDYYRLKLPQETERYVFRILAVKAVLGNPSRYGYNLPKGYGYGQMRIDRVTVTLGQPVPIQTVASAAGTTFREVKRLNPIFRADDIPAGTHEIKLPAGTRGSFEQNFAAAKASGSAGLEALPLAAPTEPRERETKPERVAASRPPEPEKPQPKTSVIAPKPQSQPQQHVVAKGETLSGIAQKYKVSVQELQKANDLKGTSVKMGQKLTIP